MPDPINIETYSPGPFRGDFSSRDFFMVLFWHKWKITLFFLASMIAVLAATFLVPEMFRSEAKIMVRIGKESVSLPPTAMTGPVISVGQSRESEINSELEILKSRELAKKVVEALGPQFFLEREAGQPALAGSGQSMIHGLRQGFQEAGRRVTHLLKEMGVIRSLDPREMATLHFLEHLNIETQKNSNILLASYEADSPERAQRVLGKLIDLFLDKHIIVHRTPGSYEFFDKQAQELRNQVRRVEEEIKSLKNRTGLTFTEEQRKFMLERIGNLQKEAEATQALVAISRAKVEDLKDKLKNLSPTVVTTQVQSSSNYAVELMRARLYELKLKEQELLSKYTEKNIAVQEVRRQIAEAQDMLSKEEATRTETTTAINATYQQLNLGLLTEMSTLSSLEAKLKVTEGQLEEARKEMDKLPEKEMTMANLQRELALQEAKYRKYSESLEQARIDQALEMNKISNISVVQPPTSSPKPVRPRKPLNLTLGFLFGLLGGIGLAFVFEFFDHSLKTPRDVEEKLNLQVLTSIPRLKKK